MPSQTSSQGSDGGGEMGASRPAADRSGALRAEPLAGSQAEPPAADADEQPWSFDADNDHITLHGAPIFRVFRADDFPCIEDEDRASADMEYLTHAQVTVMLLNVIASTTAPTVADAFRPMLAAPELLEALKQARGQVVGFMLECGYSPEAAVANVANLDAAISKALGQHLGGEGL